MEYLLTFENTHRAINGEKTLLAADYAVGVMALPSKIGKFCGICLRVDAEYILGVIGILKDAKIPVEAIFEIKEVDGEKVYEPWVL